MLGLAFLNPLLLWALPLAALPIIIHILNRRRFKKVQWAAMEFLLKAMKRNRKRLRMEQWIVLLLRVLAVLLLALLVSRPQLGGGGLIGSRTHHVVVLDDSASMTQRSGSSMLFERAQDRVRQLADDLAKTRSGDLFSIVRASHGAQPDIWITRVGPDLGRRIGTAIKEWAVSNTAPDLGRVVQSTVERAAEVEEATRTHYYVVCDQRAHDFATADDKPRPAFLAALAAMDPTNAHVTVLGVGGQQPNLTVADVRLVDRLAIANVPVTLAVDVKNFGLDATMPTTVAFQVDGQTSVSLAVPQLAPGERVSLPVTHTFGAGGFHRAEAALEATEHYPLDDRRAFAIEVLERSRVLLVDGDPDTDDGETFFLQSAFDPDGDQRFGIEAQVVSDTGIGEIDLQPFDFVWLCNVQAPPAALCERLESFVDSGGGLGIFLGPLVDIETYDKLLWREGQGLLPLPLLEVAGDPRRPEHAVLVGKDHPICEHLGEIFELLVNQVVLVHRWIGIDAVPGHDAKIVARIHDADGPPLIVTRSHGSGGGEVALFAVTADKHWSNLPVTPFFVPAVMELHRFGARRRDTSGYNLEPASIYRLDMDPGVYRADVTVRALTGEGIERTFTAVDPAPPRGSGAGTGSVGSPVAPSAGELSPVQGGWTLTVPMSELPELGAYAVEFARHDAVPERRMLALNPPLAESRLQAFTPAMFGRVYPKELHDRVTFVDADGGLGAGPGEGEIWKILAAALLLGLLVESFLAWRFGRR